jgi:hypothetical protein
VRELPSMDSTAVRFTVPFSLSNIVRASSPVTSMLFAGFQRVVRVVMRPAVAHRHFFTARAGSAGWVW